MDLLPQVGVPHIRAEIKAARASNYTLNKAFNDLIDNVIYKASQINISIKYAQLSELYRIIIHDDYEKGFENIENNDENNPFNFGHKRVGHDDDDETSEFGKGMKYSAMFLGNKFTVYTRVNDKYWKIYFNFIDMEERSDAFKSYQPIEYKNISEDEYKTYHKGVNDTVLDYGSTIIIEEIRKEAYFLQTENELK